MCQTSSKPSEPVRTWLWMSIPAADSRYWKATKGLGTLPECFVILGGPGISAEQEEINCFSLRSKNFTA